MEWERRPPNSPTLSPIAADPLPQRVSPDSLASVRHNRIRQLLKAIFRSTEITSTLIEGRLPAQRATRHALRPEA